MTFFWQICLPATFTIHGWSVCVSAEPMMMEILDELLWQNNRHVYDSMTKAFVYSPCLPVMDITGFYYLVRKQQQLMQYYRKLFYSTVRNNCSGNAVPIEKGITQLFIKRKHGHNGYFLTSLFRGGM